MTLPMARFDCEKQHCKCQAECCGVVPMPKALMEKHKDKFQRLVLKQTLVESLPEDSEIDDLQFGVIIPETEDMKCPFLQADLRCAIYEERPKLCRKFGDETSALMTCRFLDRNGCERSRQSRRHAQRIMEKNQRNVLNQLQILKKNKFN